MHSQKARKASEKNPVLDAADEIRFLESEQDAVRFVTFESCAALAIIIDRLFSYSSCLQATIRRFQWHTFHTFPCRRCSALKSRVLIVSSLSNDCCLFDCRLQHGCAMPCTWQGMQFTRKYAKDCSHATGLFASHKNATCP